MGRTVPRSTPFSSGAGRAWLGGGQLGAEAKPCLPLPVPEGKEKVSFLPVFLLVKVFSIKCISVFFSFICGFT